VATDSRATAGNWIASQTVKKVIEINGALLGTMAGGAAVSTQHHYPTHQANIMPTGLSILAGISGHAM
jgi:20S proteasome alpha/beta subunit